MGHPDGFALFFDRDGEFHKQILPTPSRQRTLRDNLQWVAHSSPLLA